MVLPDTEAAVAPTKLAPIIKLQSVTSVQTAAVFIFMDISNLTRTIKLNKKIFIIIHLNTGTNCLTGNCVLLDRRTDSIMAWHSGGRSVRLTLPSSFSIDKLT